MSDYISKQEAIDRLSEVLSSQEEFEKAKQVIIEAPTLDEKEIIRKAFERVVERLEESKMRYFLSIANTGSEIMDFAYENVGDALDEAIEIVKEECGISE